jgi:SAM-dependent methyltransferase
MQAFLKKIDRALFPDLLVKGLERELKDAAAVLDLGCGAGGPLLQARLKARLTGLDGHAPSLEKLRAMGRHAELIHAPILEAQFSPGQFEAVTALDVIEHFEKPEALKLIFRMEAWASKKCVLATPNGFLEQGVYDDNPHQLHRCGFTVSELRALGYRVRGYGGPKWLRGAHAELRFWPRPLWHRVSGALQWITWYFPGLAFGLLAVKEK